jgi:hypothetical protein
MCLNRYYNDRSTQPNTTIRMVGAWLALDIIDHTDSLSGNALSESTFPPCSLEGFIDNPEIQADGQTKDFVEFISSMLRWDPAERPSAEELLKCSWLTTSR